MSGTRKIATKREVEIEICVGQLHVTYFTPRSQNRLKSQKTSTAL